MAEQPSLSFAGLLRQLRAETKLTQEELAEAAGLSPRSVSDLERGVNRTARKDTAMLLAGALGLTGPAEELFVAAARGRAPAAAALAAADGGRPRRGGAASPYRGLSVFGEQDAPFFFGREAATAQVLDRMARLLTGAGLLVVSGVSGAGKSSLLRAGVLPRIRAAGLAGAPGAASWPCLVFTPTRAPLDELALQVAVPAGADAAAVRRELEAHPEGFALTARQAATPRAPGLAEGPGAAHDQWRRRLLLVVDQFEELFTQGADEEERRAFITALHAAAATAHGPGQAPAALVVLGVRADFEARCADYPQLVGAVQDRYLVTAMTERQLRMAITEPAKKTGSRVDNDLVDVLLTEMRNGQHEAFGAGVLPLLSHALDQAWRSRTGEAVTLADYERAGGIEGAVAGSAQRAYDALTPAEQAAARQVFTRLAATSSDGVDTADRVTRAELTDGKSPAEVQDVAAVLEAFSAERLLTLTTGAVELSHEVLLTAWPLLRDTWLADTRADRIVRTRLHTTAAEWARHARDPSYLYSGSLLQAASDTATRIGADPARHPPLSQAERDFLHASSRAHRRRVRQRQAFLAFLIALVVGLGATAVLAVRAGQQAARQRDIATSGQLSSQSQIVGNSNPALARLLSVAAWHIHRSNEGRYAMMTAAAQPGIAVLTGHTGPVVSVAFSPDGKTLASGSADDTVRLWDLATGRQIGKPLAVHAGPFNPAAANSAPFNSVSFSPDGKTLASGNTDSTARLWDVTTDRPRKPFTGHAAGTFAVAFSPDGKTLATATSDGVQLWDTTTGRRRESLTSYRDRKSRTSHRDFVWSVAFSPHGKTLASGSDDGMVRLWDAATGSQAGKPLPRHTGPVYSVAFSRDGKTLATATADGVVRLWDVATHQQIGKPLTSHGGPVYSVAFSRDGKTLATATADGTVRLWDAATGRQVGEPFTGHTGPVYSVAFSPDGKTLASGSADNTVRLWDWKLVRGSQVGEPISRDAVSGVAFSPDGKTVASARIDGTVRWWEVATGRQVTKPLAGRQIGNGRGGSGVWSVAFSRDGKTLASGSFDGSTQLWNVATGLQIRKLRPSPIDAEISVAFSPNGKTVASGGEAGTVRLWEVATGHQIGSHTNKNTFAAWSEAFSPDSRTLASGNQDGTVHLWDVATGRQIGSPLTAHAGEVHSVAFSRDGKTLASGSADGTVRLWDVATHLQIGALTGHADAVNSVAFSPDGKTLASGSADGTVRLWDVATRRQIGSPLTSHVGAVELVAFSPDGKTLAGGSDDGTVWLWNVAYTVDVVPQLCASAERPLTRSEWNRYVPGLAYQRVCP